jgi:hypothetical protein
MEFIVLFVKILFWIFLFITAVGIVKPWWVLWFLDVSNRRSVLRYYGIITLLLGLAVVVLKMVS